MSQTTKHPTSDRTSRLWTIAVLLGFALASQGCQFLQNEFFVY